MSDIVSVDVVICKAFYGRVRNTDARRISNIIIEKDDAKKGRDKERDKGDRQTDRQKIWRERQSRENTSGCMS